MTPYRTYPACGEEYDREADLEHQMDAGGGDLIDPPVDPALNGAAPTAPASPSVTVNGERVSLGAVWRTARWTNERGGRTSIECPTCERAVEILVSRMLGDRIGVHSERCATCGWVTTRTGVYSETIEVEW